ncbi:MAG: type VI secretion system tube protein Hcp [Gammaproteobacteria bacterium]|nr:type VI secretion system tube protein Hcp [Gammaproteobacteria bacterium]
MASPVYVIFTDEENQQIKSDVMIRGREHQAEGHAFDYAVSIPSDQNTGQLTAVRKHGSIVLTKNYDSASPILFNACCRGKTLKSAEFNWYRINDDGTEELYFTHKLTKVKVVKVRHFMNHVKNPANDAFGHQEEIHLRFQKIELNYPDGNIKASDDWTESRSRTY